MLDPWIIDEIRRREEERRRERDAQRIELPISVPDTVDKERSEERNDGGRRGVVVIDL